MNIQTLVNAVQSAILDGQLRALERVTAGHYPSRSMDLPDELSERSQKIVKDFMAKARIIRD